MLEDNMRTRLYGVVGLATEYCVRLEKAAEAEVKEFVGSMLRLLPKIYIEFMDIAPGRAASGDAGSDMRSYDAEEDFDSLGPGGLMEEEADEYYGSYTDETMYDGIRSRIEGLLGEDDVFLETFEDDMKYSDTPIAASISESLADIYQPLYAFVSLVRDSEGEHLEGAYRQCRADFVAYWSQSLCNVMRALNKVYFSERDE